jgi:hypothetical protein
MVATVYGGDHARLRFHLSPGAGSASVVVPAARPLGSRLGIGDGCHMVPAPRQGRRKRPPARIAVTGAAIIASVLTLIMWRHAFSDRPAGALALGAAAGIAVLVLWRGLGAASRPSRTAARKVRRATLVLPGATKAELTRLAGAVLFYRIRALRPDLSVELKDRVTVLLWRSAAFIVMAQRGAGPATRAALNRCAAAIVAYAEARPGPLSPPRSTAGLWGEDAIVDDQLLSFLSGPDASLARLVAEVLPELGEDDRARVARALEELMRDLAQQLEFGRRINP